MDSGNSHSMQASIGGGEEENDSRADQSISAFFNHHNSTAAAATARNAIPPASLYHHHDSIGGAFPGPHPPPHHQPNIDPLISNYFNLDTVWPSTTVRAVPDVAGPSSETAFFTNPTSLPDLRRNSSGSALSSDNNNINKNGNSTKNMARNPKKRSRASRRAPTTVLTTDTTNFRAMVQEFTGIPAPPFTGSSPFSRTGRFDLFGPSPNSPFPLKPFAQKRIPPSFLSSASSSSPSSSTAVIASSSSHLPSAGHQNLLNTNTQSTTNPFLNIHDPKDPLTDPSTFAAKSKALFNQSQSIKLGKSLDEFGHSGSNFGGLLGIVSSSSTSTLIHGNNNSEAENVEADLSRSINAGFGESVHRTPSFRASEEVATAVSGSSPAPENNLSAARKESMLESWIFSSD
ncbi:PREDICTED: uncharacterized protein LOC104819309 [Tarenaya hassleriana]|uniref:uncharacterized protein LOC104819309 n=1 Tax=Tarenaya hassleriana TaxID=28532 RepID=UPI00053C9BFB|nr:PREDICTED: uncharacterized protein LOC104819309 [Tarenaya hassleriana]